MIESKLGRANDAADHINQAVVREPKNMDVHFYRAIVQVRAGRLDEAMQALDEAFRCGYSRTRASKDPDLAPLQKHVGYQALMANKD